MNLHYAANDTVIYKTETIYHSDPLVGKYVVIAVSTLSVLVASLTYIIQSLISLVISQFIKLLCTEN